jgi:hypothetical protein
MGEGLFAAPKTFLFKSSVLDWKNSLFQPPKLSIFSHFLLPKFQVFFSKKLP